MSYKKKAAFLSALLAVLITVYILSLVFDPNNRRSNAFAWLDPQYFGMVDRVEVYGHQGETTLIRKNDYWFLLSGKDIQLPALTWE